jgi:hypothetical protein
LFITNTPASLSWEYTNVAVPPVGMGPDTVRTSGAANTCAAVDVVGGGRSASPTPSAPSPIASTAAAAKMVVRQRFARFAGSCCTVSSATVASSRSRIDAGGSTAVAAEMTAIVSCTARTCSKNASATSGGAAATCRSMSARSSSVVACSA